MSTSDILGIKGSGVYFPKRKVKVADLAKSFHLDFAQLLEEHGILEIHIAEESEDEFDMAVHAVKEAVDDATTNPDKIDLVIYCKSMSQSKGARNSASRIIEAIGASNAYGFDIDGGFIGGLIGIHVANDILKNSYSLNNALVVASQNFDELYVFGGNESRLRHMIFGDGAAAILISKHSSNNKILASNFVIDHYTNFIDEILVEESQETSKLKKFMHHINVVAHINKSQKHMFKELTEKWVENAYKSIEYCLNTINLDVSDINHVVKTQLSLKETKLLSERLGLNQHMIHNASVEKGHLGHADILSNLHMALKSPKLSALDIIVVIGANYDCSTGAVVVRR